MNSTNRIIAPSCRAGSLLFAAILGLASWTNNVQAATVTKSATGTDLTDGASWGGTAPGAGDIAAWASTSLGAGLTLESASSWGGIQVSGALTDISITGAGLLTLGSDGIDLNASAMNFTLGTPVALGANQAWKASLGKTLTVSGIVSGTSGLTVGGAVTSQSFTNDTFLTTTAQTLFPNLSLATITSASGKMGGAWVNGGTPLDANGYWFTNNGTTATYWLEVLDGGYTKGVKIQLDQVGPDVTVRSVQAKYVSGSYLGTNFNLGGNAGTLAQSQTAGGYGGHTTVLTAESGSGGTVTLAGANTYSGGTTLVAGRLNLNHGGNSAANSAIGTGALTITGGSLDNTSGAEVTLLPNNPQNWDGDFTYVGSVTNLNLGAGAVTLSADRTVTVTANRLTVGGSIGGSYALTKAGGGTLALTGANGYTGGTTINAGVLQVGAGGTTGDLGSGPVTTKTAGTAAAPSLRFNRSDAPTFTNDITTSGGGNNFIGAAPGTTVTLAGVINASGGQYWVSGGGRTVIAGTANNFSQGIVIGGGSTLEVASLASLTGGGSMFFNNLLGGTTLRYTGGGSESLSMLSALYGISVGTSTFDVTQADATLVLPNGHANNSGASGIAKIGAGTLELAGDNTFTGATRVSAGTLRVSGSTAPTCPITVQSNGVLTIVPGPGSGLVQGTVTTTNGGRVNGVGTIGGAVTIQGSGVLSPGTNGAIGTLYINGLLTLAAGSTSEFVIDVNDLSCSQVAGLPGVTYGGTLKVTAIGNPATLVDGNSFQLFAVSGTPGGAFSSFDLPALAGGLVWDLSGLYVNGSIKVSAAVSTPIFLPPAGGYVSPQSVQITSDIGATIFYTTDGWVTTNVYAGPVLLPANSGGFTIQAYATNAGYADSAMGTATYTTTPVPTWLTPYDSTWTGSYNWSNSVIANSSGVTADFSRLTLLQDTTVTLDSAPTVGHLLFADEGGAYNWSLLPGSGGPLTLQSASGTSIVSVSNTTVNLGVVVTGTNTLTKTGNGTLVFSALNTLSGGVTVNGGTLALTTGAAWNGGAGSIGTGPLTVNAGGTVSNTVAFALSGNAGSQTVNLNGGTMYSFRADYFRTLNLTGGTLNLDYSANAGDRFRPVNAAGAGGTIHSFAAPATATIARTGGIRGLGVDIGRLTFNVEAGTTPSGIDLLVSAPIDNTGGGGGAFPVVKTGAGTLAYAETNTYSGATTVSNGTLLVNGSLPNSPVTVISGSLGGTGTVGGAVTITSGGTLAPGASIGTLTLNNAPSLGGTVLMEINRTNSPNADLLALAAGTLTYGGTLTVQNTGPAPQLGDTFLLFNAPGGFAGSFTTTNLPALGSGLAWNWNPAAGTLSVIDAGSGPATNPTNIVASVAGNQLTLTWPASHIGWTLQAQTNSLATGLVSASNAWHSLGYATTNTATLTIDPAQPAVFFRLSLP